MKKSSTWVGIDDHKKKLSIAILCDPDEDKAELCEIPNEDRALRRLVRRLERQADGGEIRICYEAGPNGFSLKRRLEALGSVSVDVIAPSLTPRRPGQRVKTDSRDARKLAHLYRSGELTSIAMPVEEDESARDLVRTHQQVKTEIRRKQHHLLKFLTRRGRIYLEGKNWTLKHRRWLKAQQWDHWPDEASFGELMTGLGELEERRRRLEAGIDRLAAEDSRAVLVGVLRCFHGIDTVGAVMISTEVFNVERFKSPRRLMSYLGLTVSVDQSGDRDRRGSITKSGNRFVRFLLGQAAWHYRHRPSVGQVLRKRRKDQPAWAIAIADRAHRRLYRRYWTLVNKGKSPHKAATAVARELVGFLWEAMIEVQLHANGEKREAA